MSLRTAAEHVRVAHALEKLPRISEAFAAGRISYSKVRAITRIAGADTATITACAEAQGVAEADADRQADPARPVATDAAAVDASTTPVSTAASDAVSDSAVPDPAVADRVLLSLALAGTASHVETVVRAVRRRRTPPDELTARRPLSWHWDQDGSLVLRGRFTPDEGAALVAAVEAMLPTRGPSRHGVEAGAERGSEDEDAGTEQDAGAGREADVADDRIAARRADALLALVVAEPATPEKDEGVVVARGRGHVVVHVDTGTATARVAGGPELATATAERLACDARVQLALGERATNRLYLGRTRRLASPAQITALTARDGGRCGFPGCTRARYLHAHHIRPWLRGGRTDVDNLVLLCGPHHRLVHDHGYGIRRTSGRWEFHRPDGTSVPAAGDPLTGDVERLLETHAHDGPHITRDSLTPSWGGERLDPAAILDVLLPPARAAAA
jgi:hypothetical protein